MSKDLTKRTGATKPERQESVATDPLSRLKSELMADAVDRLLGKDESTAASDIKSSRVLFAVANHADGPGWGRAKSLQRLMFDASAGGALQMKFACWGPDNSSGVRRFRIGRRWITDPDDMAGHMDKAECNCGCYVNICDVLDQAVKENEDRTMRAVVIAGDAFHDDEDSLAEAAVCINQLHRAGTKVFLFQLSNDSATARKLKYLARVSGAIHLPFDPRTQERQVLEMWRAVSAYATGDEEAVKATGQAGTLLLEYLKQQPMPVLEAREHVRVKRDTSP
jgi:hypothetical protein